ncbi:glycosyltransferase [Halobacteriovorax marinus]|uniref:glycosyltransferase n=1 Tax=Halobacteriovorax marinus TaxID=97084 RepID=UPI003A91BEFE
MSKIKRDSIQIDPCELSMSILRERCEYFFENHTEVESSQRVYVEDPNEKSLGKNRNEIVDIILFGNAYKSFFNSGNWIGRDFRIWVLSHSNKKIVDSFFDNEDVANVIPRYSLFPRTKKRENSFICGEDCNFVYAGRISAQKNIESILYFLYYYRDKYSSLSTLSIYGEFEDTYHEDLGRRFQESYENRIKKIVKDLGLEESVTFHGKVEAASWTRVDYENPVFISLSTFISEDYGCAAAEAQEQGWPLLVSDFGGHQDIIGKGVVKVPYNYIGNSHLPIEVISQLSSSLISNLEAISKNEEVLESIDNLNSYSVIDIDKIDEYRRKIVEKIGPDVNLIHSDYVGAFADTVAGSFFFRDIKKCLYDHKENISVIAFDFDEEFNESQRQSLLELFEKVDMSNCSLNFISSKNLKYKDTLHLLLISKKVLIIKDRLKVIEVKKMLEDKLNIDPSRIFYA